jgi:hypothetical protein
VYLNGNLTIRVSAGDPSGGLVADIQVTDTAGDVLDEASGIPLAAGTTLTYGPIGLEVHLDSVLNQGAAAPAPARPGTPAHTPPLARPQPPKK